jgi:hypothetical protein
VSVPSSTLGVLGNLCLLLTVLLFTPPDGV